MLAVSGRGTTKSTHSDEGRNTTRRYPLVVGKERGNPRIFDRVLSLTDPREEDVKENGVNFRNHFI